MWFSYLCNCYVSQWNLFLVRVSIWSLVLLPLFCEKLSLFLYIFIVRRKSMFLFRGLYSMVNYGCYSLVNLRSIAGTLHIKVEFNFFNIARSRSEIFFVFLATLFLNDSVTWHFSWFLEIYFPIFFLFNFFCLAICLGAFPSSFYNESEK
jgi:hypothetical protein